MSWRDNLRPASFRGVEFHYEDLGRDFGRRVKTHKYPGKNDPYHEDLGADADAIRINAYVLEPDHMAKADRLRDALLKKGAGTLVHPYYGEITVVFLTANETITTREGGMVRFNLRFERAGPNRNPSSRVDTASLVGTRAAEIDAAAIANFGASFSVEGQPGWIADSAEEDLGAVLDTTDLTLGDAVNAAGDVADLAFAIADIRTNAATLIRNPSQLATRLSTTLGSMSGVSPMLKLASDGFGLATVAATTPSRLLQKNNRQALVDLLGGVSLSGAIRSLPGTTFETTADAYTARDAIAAEVDRQSLIAPYSVARTLSAGLAAVARHVSATAPALPRLIRVTPAMTRPSIVHAYDLYGDDVEGVITRAGQIAQRNRLRHPGFVPAGDVMEVLGNV